MILTAVRAREDFYFPAPAAPGVSGSAGERDERDSPANGGQTMEGDGDATGLLPWSLRQTLSW